MEKTIASSLLVSTSRRRRPATWQRAKEVANRCGGMLIPPSGSVEERIENAGATALYVVTQKREELRDARGNCLFVHPGLFSSKMHYGKTHPLVRAVCGGKTHFGDDVPADILDLTLGLAGDAMLLAGTLEVPVIGLEKSPVVHCLLQAGLRQMAEANASWSLAAKNIELRSGCAFELMEAKGEKLADVVTIDPMMRHPRASSPGYSLFRLFAEHKKWEADHLKAASRMARKRVVLKIASARKILPRGLTWHERVTGSAADFLVHECTADNLTLK
jgi:hypothetical protein